MKPSILMTALSCCTLVACESPLDQVTPPEQPRWQQVSATLGITCAVDSAERLYCWTNEDAGSTRIAEAQNFQAIEGNCALTEEGIAYCWSRNALPERVDDTSWTEVSGGPSAGCGIDLSGETYCWSAEYRSGEGDVRLPVARVSNDQGFESISAGPQHACGLTSDGRAYCWYVGKPPQYPNGILGVSVPPAERMYAVAVETDQRFEHVVVDRSHTCAINEEGEAYCWGFNLGAQLGVPRDPDREGCSGLGPPEVMYPSYWCTKPQKVITELRFSTVEIGGSHSCGLDLMGRAYCWGSNVGKALGVESAGDKFCRLGGYYDCTYEPIPVSTDREFVALSSGVRNDDYCAIDSEGDVYCWGYLGDDGLPEGGVDFFEGLSTPTKIPDPPPLAG